MTRTRTLGVSVIGKRGANSYGASFFCFWREVSFPQGCLLASYRSEDLRGPCKYPSPFSFLFVLACLNFFTFLLPLSLSPSLPLSLSPSLPLSLSPSLPLSLSPLPLSSLPLSLSPSSHLLSHLQRPPQQLQLEKRSASTTYWLPRQYQATVCFLYLYSLAPILVLSFFFLFLLLVLYFIIIYANYSAVAIASPFACFSYSFCLSSLVVSPALI